ncbi:MAG: hypothetical protein P4L46_20805 [Fimbriimonas sp.]|nr:hypothetical protein [Fimbriimonas sp.]
MPELCRLLAAATGQPHSVESELGDYSVFVSAKNGDPARVRTLVARALRATWREDKGRYRLVSVRPRPDANYAEFERLFRKGMKVLPNPISVPIHDLYRMAPGQTIRYGPTETPYIRQLPAELNQPNVAPGGITIVRRMAAGVFEFEHGMQVSLDGLPESVTTFLGDARSKRPFTPEQIARIKSISRNQSDLKLDWSQAAKRDPIAAMQDLLLPQIAKEMACDLAVALPDFTFFAFADPEVEGFTVEAVLSAYSLAIVWTVIDGAIVGILPDCEYDFPGQARRIDLAKYVQAIKNKGAAGVSDLAEYVSDQRPVSSNTWTDVMMLVMAGVVVDQEFIGDYPYNLRLFTRLTPDDWTRIRSGRAFSAATFSQPVQDQVMDVLLQSRSRDFDKSTPDPATWDTLDLSRLTAQATYVEEPVLIGLTASGAEVQDARTSGMSYSRQRDRLGKEPLYQPGTRRKVKLQIRSSGQGQTVTTGFSEVVPSKIKPTIWRDLPSELAAAFKGGMEAILVKPDTGTGKPPP